MGLKSETTLKSFGILYENSVAYLFYSLNKLESPVMRLSNPTRPGRTFVAYELVIRREYLEELRRPLAF